MARQQEEIEKRRHPRVSASKIVKAKVNEQEIEGSLIDISAGGAALEVNSDWEDDMEVELDIEDMSLLQGRITRSFDDGIAVSFDLDEEDEDRLFDEMLRLQSDVKLFEE